MAQSFSTIASSASSSSSSSSQVARPNIGITGSVNGNYILGSQVQINMGTYLPSPTTTFFPAALLASPLLSFSTNAQYPMRELLQNSYETRAKLTGFLFKDHDQLLHDVSFTIAYYDVDKEKARLEAKRQKERIKEEKFTEDSLEEDPWTATWRAEEITSTEMISIKDIFIPTTQLQNQKKSGDLGKGPASESKELAPEAPIRKVLILGPAGSGKTTLSKHLMREWLKKRSLTQYENAFWITARDLNNKEKRGLFKKCANAPYPLAALIHQLCLDEDAQKKIGIKAIDRLLKDNKTLVLLDGFDEVAHWLGEVPEKGKPLKTLLQAILDTKSDLLVTSRDYSIPPEDIYKFNRYLINRGFTDVQIESYITNYFASLPKLEEKSGKKSPQDLTGRLRENLRLWSHVHNPLILTLFCEYSRLQQESGAAEKELNLLDLYEETLKVFLRRYLDLHTQAKKELDLSWEATKEYTLKNLLKKCAVEIDFLETLSFMGIEQGRQLLDPTLKKKALEEVETRCSKISKVPIRNALILGVLHEFSGNQASSLDKTHEFLHLTFQEYFAARYIAERLQRHDRKLYAWLRENKYNPNYRMVWNFLCAQMSPEKYRYFWKIFLEERTDITSIGHFQLILHSLEARRYDQVLNKHLEVVEQFLVHFLKTEKFINTVWIQTSVHECPQLLGHLSGRFWEGIDQLLKDQNSEGRRQVLEFLKIMVVHPYQLSVEKQKWLFRVLCKKVGDKERDLRDAATEILASYVGHLGEWSEAMRTELFKFLAKEMRDEDAHLQQAVINGLISYVSRGGQLSEEEHDQLFEFLRVAAVTKSFHVRRAAVKGLAFYASQARQWKWLEELLESLKKAAWDNDESVQSIATDALTFYESSARQWPKKAVHSQSMDSLLKATNDENEGIRTAAIKALTFYAIQPRQWSSVDDYDEKRVAAIKGLVSYAAQASEKERIQLLATFLKAAADEHESVRVTAIKGLASYVSARQWPEKERVELLEFLQKAAGNVDRAVRIAAVESLASYARQARQWPEAERSQWFDSLRKAGSDAQEREVRIAAIEGLASYAAQASEKERPRLLDTLLKATCDRGRSVRIAAVGALASYVRQAEQFLEEARSHCLQPLLKAIHLTDDERDSSIRESLYSALACLLVHDQDWLKMPYAENYSVLNQMLTDNYGLRTLPVNELLNAYFIDEATQPSESNPRSDLWLKFLIVRMKSENIAIVVEKDRCKLYSAQFRQAVIVSAPEKNRIVRIEKLKKALSSGIETSFLAGYTDNLVELPPETPATFFGESVFTQDLSYVSEIQDRFEREMKGGGSSVDSSIEAYKKHLEFSEKGIQALQIQIKTHENIAMEHESVIAALKKATIQAQRDIEIEMGSFKAEFKNAWIALKPQKSQLKEVTKKFLEIQFLPKIAAQNMRELQAQHANLQKKCEVSENHILEKYLEFFERIKAEIATLKKFEAKFEASIQNLQKNYETLMPTFQEIQKSIDQLQQQDAHTLDTLEKLQTFKAREEAVINAYQGVQRKLAEQENCLNHPKYAKFYRAMYLKLNEFFMICTAVASANMINDEPQTKLSEKITQKMLEVLGENILPSAKVAADFVYNMTTWHQEHEKESGAAEVGASTSIASTGKETAIDLAIQEIIHRYGEHIKKLTYDGVRDLAECALNRIAHGIQQEKPLEDPKNFPLYLVDLLHQVMLKPGKLGHKDLETEPGVLPKGEKPWNTEDFFRHTKIQSTSWQDTSLKSLSSSSSSSSSSSTSSSSTIFPPSKKLPTSLSNPSNSHSSLSSLSSSSASSGTEIASTLARSMGSGVFARSNPSVMESISGSTDNNVSQKQGRTLFEN